MAECLFNPQPVGLVVPGETELCMDLGACFRNQPLRILWRAVVSVNGAPAVLQSADVLTSSNANGRFCVALPLGWTHLELRIILRQVRVAPAQQPAVNRVPVRCRLYFPEGCDWLMQDPLLVERLMLERCNRRTVDTNGLDHAAPGSVPNDIPGRVQHQLGPCKASRAVAITHIAIFECVLAVVGGYHSYLGLPHCLVPTDMSAAIAQATRDTLFYLYPSHVSRLDSELALELATIPNGDAKTEGIALGAAAAAAIIARRTNDGSAASYPEPRLVSAGGSYPDNTAPGLWRRDPISNAPVAMGAYWDQVTPFVIPSASAFRCPPFPAFTSAQFAAEFNHVKSVGGDGIITPTVRDAEGTHIGIYWAFDGTPSLCAPPRLYDQIAMYLARQEHLGMVETARMLAMLHVGMADAGIAAWESKWHYQIGRPVTLIRDAAASPGAFHASIVGDATWKPLGAPASNTNSVDFTPGFCAYPSGHATFGGTLFQTLRYILGSDSIPFTFVSEEYNGITQDVTGQVRPYAPRSFTTLTQAENENAASRMFLGIHFEHDKLAGIAQGRQVANHVFAHLYQPV